MSAPAPAARHRLIGSPLGPLIVSAAAHAIMRIEWAAPMACPPAESIDDSPLLARAAEQLAEYFAGARRAFDLPLAPVGTVFQRHVWAEMARIPWSETRTYGALAHRIGSAPRAVGRACAANPIPIIVPCHRVLAGGGIFGGYSGGDGSATKAALLALEGVHAARVRDLVPNPE